MVVITGKDIAPLGGKALDKALPSWLNKADEIVKGINQLFEHYYNLSGKTPPAAAKTETNAAANPDVKSFSDARQEKKAEMANKGKGDNMPDMFRELLAGLLKTCITLENMGFADKKVGECLYELPFSVKQAKEFLTAVYQKHYGGK